MENFRAMTDDELNMEAAIYGLPVSRPIDLVRGRDALELLTTDFLDALRQGNNPSIDTYAGNHPDLASEIRELFPMLAAMEGWKTYRERNSFDHRTLQQLPNGRCGHFHIEREIGRGGMGIVFEGIEQSSGRHVAIKVLPFFNSKALRSRFEREATTASGLRHRHIVPVYGFGEHDGMCYYAMKLIRGVGLDWVIGRLCGSNGAVYSHDVARRFDRSRSTTEPSTDVTGCLSNEPKIGRPILARNSWHDVARMGAQIADALHYAHCHGTLHRDIKPANLLFDTNGQVWITDFGLAHDTQQLLHVDGLGPAGTLRYIAPEQFSGRVDIRSDIYSVGITLFELVTRTPAFGNCEPNKLFESITQSSLTRPRHINPKIPRDLEAIVLKCTARDAALRYSSAAELLADLLRFHRGERVRARGALGWFKLPRGNRIGSHH